MRLHTFLEQYQDAAAHRKIKDYLRTDDFGTEKAEFLGHFLTSVFQPVLELQEYTLKTVGFEAFVRPIVEDTAVTPIDFFDSLDDENADFVDGICRELHVTNFLKHSLPSEFISINVQPALLETHTHRFEVLQKQIERARKNRIGLSRIIVELDISPGLDPGVVYAFASRLKEQNIQVTLENFDADCASFSRITHIRPDVVKFNRSWLNHPLSDSSHIDLVSGVVNAAKCLGAKAHLERIESAEELNFAIACRFDRFQGYHLGAPSETFHRPEIILNA